MGRGINFGPSRPWGAVSQTEYRRMARDDRHLLLYRVHFAALGWANRIGHAEFGEGALAEILARNDKPLTRQSLANAINRARSLGLTAAESCSRCLVLSGLHFQKAGLGTSTCKTHGISGRKAARVHV